MDRIKHIWAIIQTAIAAAGGVIGYFLGDLDGMLTALLIFIVLDYITGVMCGIIEKKLSSEIGFKGIFKKVCILLIVGMANIIDVHMIGTGSTVRGIVLCFYISNEGISVLENASRIGLPIPEKLKTILKQLHQKDAVDDSDSELPE